MIDFERGDITVIRAVIPGLEAGNYEDVLLMHRHQDHKRNPGVWELPGGQIGSDIEDPFAAVIEQILQKTGITVAFKVPALSMLERRVLEDTGGLYVAYAGVVRYVSGSLNLSPEHDFAKWQNPERPEGLSLAPQAESALTLYNNRLLGVIDLAGENAVAPADLVELVD